VDFTDANARSSRRAASRFIPAVRAPGASRAGLRNRSRRAARLRIACWLVFLAIAALFPREAGAAGPLGSYAFRSYGPDQGLRNQA
jgi:hypothetical protein